MRQLHQRLLHLVFVELLQFIGNEDAALRRGKGIVGKLVNNHLAGGQRAVEIVGLVLQIGQGLEQRFLVGAGAAHGDGFLIGRLGVIGFACIGQELALGQGERFR